MRKILVRCLVVLLISVCSQLPIAAKAGVTVSAKTGPSVSNGNIIETIAESNCNTPGAETLKRAGDVNALPAISDSSLKLPEYTAAWPYKGLPNPPSREGVLNSSGYLSVGLKLQRMFDEAAMFGAIHGGWIINQRIYVGACMHTLIIPEYTFKVSGQDHKLNLLYGGFEGGYSAYLNRYFSLRGQLIMGITSIFYKSWVYRDGDAEYRGNDTLVIEPGIYADMQVLKWLAVFLGISYHLTLGVEGYEGISNGEMNSPAIEVLFMIVGF